MLMQPVFKKLSSFKVAGYGIQTNVTDGFMKDIAVCTMRRVNAVL